MTLTPQSIARASVSERRPWEITKQRPRSNPDLNPFNDGTIDLPHGDFIHHIFYRGGTRWNSILPALTRRHDEPHFRYYGKKEFELIFSNMLHARANVTHGYSPDEYEETIIFGGRTILFYFFNPPINGTPTAGPYQIVLSETFFVDNCRPDHDYLGGLQKYMKTPLTNGV